MPGNATHAAHQRGKPLLTLAERPLPRRVRAVLEGVLEYGADELGRGLLAALAEYEQALFLQSEQAAHPEVRRNFGNALREIRYGRETLLAAFRAGLESALAGLRDAPVEAAAPPAPAGRVSLALVDDVEIEENIIINEASGRAEIRNSLALFLLGQRFAVVAAQPAFDADTLPVGPRQLCEIVRRAADTLELSIEHRLLLLKHFDRECLQKIAPFYEALNAYLIKQRVLPNLSYVPIRARRVAQKAPAAAARPASAQPSAAQLGLETVAHEPRTPLQAAGLAEAFGTDAPPQPVTRWPGQADPASEQAGEQQQAEMFGLLQELLAGRRALVGKLGGKLAGNGANAQVADAAALQRALATLQARQPRDAAAPQNSGNLKQDLLAHLRQLADGEASALADDDADTLELLGLLLEHLSRELRPNSPALPLLGRLQLPLLRLALADRGFFTRRQHPARQIVNAIAEASEFLDPDDGADRAMLERMRHVVDRAADEYDSRPTLFADLLGELNQHLQSQARKAEVAERRHVEAARGREKLETARLRATETLDALLSTQRLPRFLRTLLKQAWGDVLSLAMLRHGADSEPYREQLRIAERLIEAAAERRHSGRFPIDGDEAQQLREAIEAALTQVGYHVDDAQAIAARLLASADEDDDAASTTELAMRLKQRVRFGQEADAAAAQKQKFELTEVEQAELERIEKLPLGTWFEFSVNQQGDVERRRLSWFSTVTGHCLFLNHRGQRAGEYSLQWLAREVARGNVRIVMQPPGTLVDRAWSRIVRALRSFAGGPEQP